MNKYQQALDKIESAAYYGGEKGDNVELLQELVDRATPKKPNIVREPFAYASYNCAKCDEPALRSWAGERPRMMPEFCQYCGQAIDWSKDE